MIEIEMKQGEQRRIKFVVKEGETAYDLTGATFQLKIATDDAVTVVITKDDGDFDKTDVADGIAYVTITSTDSDQDAALYIGELKITLSGGSIDKSEDIQYRLKRAIT